MSLLSILNLLMRSNGKHSLMIATVPFILLTVGCSSFKQSSQPPASSETAIAASIVPNSPKLDAKKILVGQENLSNQTISKSQTCIEENHLDESMKFALQAANLAQTAKSKSEWDEVARLWLQAVAWMQAVPANSPKRVFAEKKVIEYMRNLAYSQQQAARSGSVAQFPSFDSEPLDQQLQLYLSYLSTFGRPDILIVGSSRALQGVDPAQMQQALAKKGYQNLRIFNFGVNGATAQVVDYILRKVLTPEQLPKLIIWADGVRAFNSGRIDRTYEAIIASQAHQKIAAGIRPQLAKAEPNSKTKCYQLPNSCKQKDNPKFQFETSSFIQNYDSSLAAISNDNTLSGYQNLFYRPSEFNVSATLVSLDAIEANGFLPLSIRFNPKTYYQQKPYVSGAYDGDYRAFNLGGEQARAFDSVVAFVRSNNIQLVLVNLPLTDDYLDGTRWSAEVEFQEQMQQLSQEYGFIFIDLSEKALTQYNYFADPSHLNRYGASIVAQTIVANPSIPWPRARS
ncbi:DUF1574 family protein [Planktothrix mougeotii]|nr:DUF1574 family protein [Planktothrix mougeotii]